MDENFKPQKAPGNSSWYFALAFFAVICGIGWRASQEQGRTQPASASVAAPGAAEAYQLKCLFGGDPANRCQPYRQQRQIVVLPPTPSPFPPAAPEVNVDVQLSLQQSQWQYQEQEQVQYRDDYGLYRQRRGVVDRENRP